MSLPDARRPTTTHARGLRATAHRREEGVARKAEGEGQDDRRPSRQSSLSRRRHCCAGRHAGCADYVSFPGVDSNGDRVQPLAEIDAGPDRGVDQNQVQVFTPESKTSKQAGIARFNRDTVPGHEHAVHLQRGALEFAVQAETFENAPGARVQGVATKLGTREGRSIDQAHTRPCAGQHSRGDRADWSAMTRTSNMALAIAPRAAAVPDDDRAVLRAKPEAVAEGSPEARRPAGVRHVIEVARRILRKLVDGGRKVLALEGE